jgi:putative flavoprotein involved in K+ transport
MDHVDIAIIGGGQAGLAAAHGARHVGLAPVLLEAGNEPGGSWPRYYDSLVLFSPARYSELPGRPFGGDPERYPTRDELVDYLRSYARELGADIRTRQRVTRVTPQAGGGFAVVTAAGLDVTADLVIAASGGFGAPHRPALPGLATFTGDAIHASEYRDPAGYAGKRVVVVGGGDSAVQIAADLAGVARVSIATRSPLRFLPQRPLGRDLHWWLDRTGLDTAPFGPRILARRTAAVDDGRHRAALATGNPDARPLFARLDGGEVVWRDGECEHVDAVILATGYRPEVRYLRDTAALGPDGEPLQRRGVSTTVPGLGYVGLEFQRSFASNTVRGVGRDAEFVVGRLLSRRGRVARDSGVSPIYNAAGSAAPMRGLRLGVDGERPGSSAREARRLPTSSVRCQEQLSDVRPTRTASDEFVARG